MLIPYALFTILSMSIINLLVSYAVPIFITYEPDVDGGVLVRVPGIESLKKYKLFVVNPDSTEGVKPVTCMLHIVEEDFAVHIPTTFEFVKLLARAFIKVEPDRRTMEPIDTVASQVTSSKVLSPRADADPEP